MIELLPANAGHIGRIANHMREMDRIEVGAMGHSPKSALRTSLAGSILAVTAKVDGVPHAMFGVLPISALDGTGRPWFLGTDEVYRHGRELIRAGPAIVEQMHRHFGLLENWVSSRNLRALALLRRWGFTVAREEVDVGGVGFVKFWRKR